ncbi:MAG: membrane integrity-associated transporter subunit PqiC, partial [Rhizobiales bacterium]|nr:membrane integrity-associated transporter subunit PqiC [Hyphomicrobiales bacterium]
LTPVETSLIFDLVPIKADAVKGRPVRFSLSISQPRSSAILDSDKVVVRPLPVVIQYYENIIWSDRIPKLIHRRITQAFEDSGRIKSVGARADGFDSQYDLVLEIRDFQIEPSLQNVGVSKNALHAKVTIFAKLISERSARVLRSIKITEIVEIKLESRENIALAFNEAFKKTTISLVNWTLK